MKKHCQPFNKSLSIFLVLLSILWLVGCERTADIAKEGDIKTYDGQIIQYVCHGFYVGYDDVECKWEKI